MDWNQISQSTIKNKKQNHHIILIWNIIYININDCCLTMFN